MTDATPAIIKKEIVSLLTYPFSDPSPVPEFGRLYPYNRFDGYTDEGVMHDREMIVMENDHIKLWVDPDVGGKVWGAIEKNTGKEFIYFNHVAKFRDVAMRGPWTSGGMEFNMGIIGHTPSCSAPVDHYLTENADGSVSCFVGATDWPSRTRWMVEILLPADTAYFTTRTAWYNNSRLERSYYQWNNVGVKAAGNLEYVNPGNLRIGHDGKALSWPVDEQGRQLSLYEKNDHAEYRSYHIYGSYADFWGCYWHDDQFGFGHSAAYDDKPGKKIWIWGLSRFGMIWEDLLTDSDGQYTEVQSGRLFSQSIAASSKTPFKHASLLPYVYDQWDEHWFPVTNLSGLTYGDRLLSFYFDIHSEKPVLQLCANSPLSGELRVQLNEEVVIRENIELNTLERKDILLPKCTLNVLGLYFNNELIYDGLTVNTPLKRPVLMPADHDPSTVYALYTEAKEWERQRFYERAVDAYNACLEKDRYYLDALTGLAGIRIKQCLYVQAYELLVTALSLDTYDALANYLYGVVNTFLDKYADAKDGFSIACRSPEFRTAAYVELAKVYMRQQQYVRALGYVHKALEYSKHDQQAIQIMIVIARLTGATEHATNLIQDQLKACPLDHLARFEQYQIGTIDANAFRSHITSELPYETYLELASFYLELHLYNVCLEILTLSPSYAMVSVWKAFVASIQGLPHQEDQFMLEATGMHPSFVFPHRQEDVKVLEWAVKYYRSWKMDYYLALAYIQMLRKEEALGLLLKHGNEPDVYVFYLVRANLQRLTDPVACETDLRRAVRSEGSDYRATLALSKYLADQKRWPEALDVVEAGYYSHPGNYYLGLHYAACLMHTAQFEKGIDLMNGLMVLPNEGASEGRNVWRETHLYAALHAMDQQNYDKALLYISKARVWPEHMGVGRPYVVDERLEDFMELNCLRRKEQQQGCGKLVEQIINYRHEHPDTPYSANDTLSICILLEQQRLSEARELLRTWQSTDANDLAAGWTEAFITGNQDALSRIAQLEPARRIPLPYEILFEDRSFVFVKEMYKRQLLSTPANAETNV